MHGETLKLIYGSCFDNRYLVSVLVHFTEYFLVVTVCTVMWKKSCNMHS